MTDLRLPPVEPTPMPAVRVGGDEPTADANALLVKVERLEAENDELQAYLDRVLDALATAAAEEDHPVVVDDPLAPTEYRPATPADSGPRPDERRSIRTEVEPGPAITERLSTAEIADAVASLLIEATAQHHLSVDDSTDRAGQTISASAPTRLPSPAPTPARRRTDQVASQIDATRTSLIELLHLLDRERLIRERHDEQALP